MNMVDYIAIAIIVLIVGAALFYIIRAKKRGEKCVGCPYARGCRGNSCGCGHMKSDKKNKHQ
jgi:hypothetical protein